MCDPVTIGGIALTGLSTALNASASSRVQNARDDALAAERTRQGQLDAQAQAVNNQTRDVYKNTGEKEAKRGKQLGEYFTDRTIAAPQESRLPTSASNVTVQEEGKQRGNARAFTDNTGAALGNLRSFGDLLADNSINQARGAQEIGQIGGFKRGSNDVLSYELDDAGHAGDGLKTFGDIASGIGGLALQKGLSTPAVPTPFKSSLGDLIGAKGFTNPGTMPIGRLLDRRSMPGYASVT